MDVSVVICTRNRAESLRKTLQLLISSDRSGIEAEVVVVDNDSSDDTRVVVAEMNGELPIRYLHEARLGKYYALNRALDEGGLGDLLAIIDDDISPYPGWFQGVVGVARRWPEHAVFTGPIRIEWPDVEIPDWARSNDWIHMVAFSSMDLGDQDRVLNTGWPSGNNYFVRTAKIPPELRLEECELLYDAMFACALMARSGKSVSAGDAVVGHRIQARLIDKRVVLTRARVLGKETAHLRIRFPQGSTRRARVLQYPVLGRCAAGLKLIYASLLYVVASCHLSQDERFVRRIPFQVQLANSWELLLHIGKIRREVLRLKGD